MENFSNDTSALLSRRKMMKASGVLFGGLFLSSATSPIYAKTNTSSKISKIFKPTAQNPLLLSSNENSLGVSKKASLAITQQLPQVFRYLGYSMNSPRTKLIHTIAQNYGLKPENVTLGNGSSETIQASIQALIFKAKSANKPVQLVVPELTFEFARLYAQSLKIPISKIPLTSTMEFDLLKMQKIAEDFQGVSIVYLCNPNNPTGLITAASKLDKWIKAANNDIFFIFDEAYGEYVDDKNFESGLKYIQSGVKNVILTKTFSKLYALAGLRVGYGLGDAELIKEVESFVELDNVNILGGVAALASLEDKDFARKSVKTNAVARKILEDTLDELQIKYLSSQANFVFYKVKNDVATFIKKMAERHIVVGREFPPYSDYNRVSLGTPPEISAFCLALKDFRVKGWI